MQLAVRTRDLESSRASEPGGPAESHINAGGSGASRREQMVHLVPASWVNHHGMDLGPATAAALAEGLQSASAVDGVRESNLLTAQEGLQLEPDDSPCFDVLSEQDMLKEGGVDAPFVAPSESTALQDKFEVRGRLSGNRAGTALEAAASDPLGVVPAGTTAPSLAGKMLQHTFVHLPAQLLEGDAGSEVYRSHSPYARGSPVELKYRQSPLSRYVSSLSQDKPQSKSGGRTVGITAKDGKPGGASGFVEGKELEMSPVNGHALLRPMILHTAAEVIMSAAETGREHWTSFPAEYSMLRAVLRTQPDDAANTSAGSATESEGLPFPIPGMLENFATSDSSSHDCEHECDPMLSKVAMDGWGLYDPAVDKNTIGRWLYPGCASGKGYMGMNVGQGDVPEFYGSAYSPTPMVGSPTTSLPPVSRQSAEAARRLAELNRNATQTYTMAFQHEVRMSHGSCMTRGFTRDSSALYSATPPRGSPVLFWSDAAQNGTQVGTHEWSGDLAGPGNGELPPGEEGRAVVPYLIDIPIGSPSGFPTGRYMYVGPIEQEEIAQGTTRSVPGMKPNVSVGVDPLCPLPRPLAQASPDRPGASAYSMPASGARTPAASPQRPCFPGIGGNSASMLASLLAPLPIHLPESAPSTQNRAMPMLSATKGPVPAVPLGKGRRRAMSLFSFCNGSASVQAQAPGRD